MRQWPTPAKPARTLPLAACTVTHNNNDDDRPPAPPEPQPAPFVQLILGVFLVIAFCAIVWLVFRK